MTRRRSSLLSAPASRASSVLDSEFPGFPFKILLIRKNIIYTILLSTPLFDWQILPLLIMTLFNSCTCFVLPQILSQYIEQSMWYLAIGLCKPLAPGPVRVVGCLTREVRPLIPLIPPLQFSSFCICFRYFFHSFSHPVGRVLFHLQLPVAPSNVSPSDRSLFFEFLG